MSIFENAIFKSFKHLKDVLHEEDIEKQDNVTVGGIVFTTISIRRNYNCNIPIDLHDLSFGFFILFDANNMYLFFAYQFIFYFIIYQLLKF